MLHDVSIRPDCPLTPFTHLARSNKPTYLRCSSRAKTHAVAHPHPKQGGCYTTCTRAKLLSPGVAHFPQRETLFQGTPPSQLKLSAHISAKPPPINPPKLPVTAAPTQSSLLTRHPVTNDTPARHYLLLAAKPSQLTDLRRNSAIRCTPGRLLHRGNH